jgi:hypothetical protein
MRLGGRGGKQRIGNKESEVLAVGLGCALYGTDVKKIKKNPTDGIQLKSDVPVPS